MASDMARLIVSLEAKTAAFEKAMNRALGIANSRSRAIETRFAKMNKNLTSGFSAVSGKIAAAFAFAGGVAGAKDLLDASIKINNSLKVAGLEGEALTAVYDALYLSAQRNAAPLEALVTLYGRASMAAQNLGASQESLLRFSDTVAMSLRVSGQSASEASGALLQLSQVLGGSVVQAQEYNSLIDGAYPLLQAVASGLREAGGDVSKLTQLVKAGEVPVKAFFDAALAGSDVLKDKLATSVLTIDQRLQNLRNALVDAAGRFNESSEAANTFGEAIDDVANYVNGIDMNRLVQQIVSVINAFQEGIRWANNFGRSISEAIAGATGLDEVGKMITGGAAQKSFLGGALTVTSTKALQERIDAAFEQQIQKAGELTEKAILQSVLGQGGGATQKTGRLPEKAGLTPVSLEDYELTSKDKKGGGKSKQSEYAREIEQIKERTAALQAETEAMAGINPLINDYGYAVEYASAKQELLNAAKQAGLEITPALAANIDTLATAYAKASAESEKLAEEQDKLRDMAEDFNGFAKDILGGFIQDLKDGKSATEALESALGKVADKLLDIALSAIFGGSGGIGGLLAGIFGKKYAEGGYTGAGGKNQPAGTVHKGEYVFSKKATQKIGVGNLEAMHRGAKGYAAGGFVGPAAPRFAGPQAASAPTSISISISAPINAPGADPAQLARVERSVQELGRNVPKMVVKTMHDKEVRKGRV